MKVKFDKTRRLWVKGFRRCSHARVRLISSFLVQIAQNNCIRRLNSGLTFSDLIRLRLALEFKFWVIVRAYQSDLIGLWSWTWCIILSAYSLIVIFLHILYQWRWSSWLLCFSLSGSREVIFGLLLNVAQVTFPTTKIYPLVLVRCISDCLIVLFQLLLSVYRFGLHKVHKILFNELRGRSIILRFQCFSASLLLDFLSTTWQFLFDWPSEFLVVKI